MFAQSKALNKQKAPPPWNWQIICYVTKKYTSRYCNNHSLRHQVLTSGLFSRNCIFIFCTESNWAPVKPHNQKNALLINAQNPLNICSSLLFLSLDLCSDDNYQTQAKCRKSPQQSLNPTFNLMETEQLQNKHNVFIFSAAHDICHKAITNKP